METLLALTPVLLVVLTCLVLPAVLGAAAWVWAKARRGPANDERSTLVTVGSER
jgi:hypothetical protein